MFYISRRQNGEGLIYCRNENRAYIEYSIAYTIHSVSNIYIHIYTHTHTHTHTCMFEHNYNIMTGTEISVSL
jgi:hypothetical protein